MGPAAVDAITGANDYTFRSGRQSLQDVATAGSILEDQSGKVVVLAQDTAFGQANVAAVETVFGGEGATCHGRRAHDVSEHGAAGSHGR